MVVLSPQVFKVDFNVFSIVCHIEGPNWAERQHTIVLNKINGNKAPSLSTLKDMFGSSAFTPSPPWEILDTF